MAEVARVGEWLIPDDAAPYKQTREFTAATTPAALQRAHDTRAGVWGELLVLEGSLRFFDLRPGGPSVLLGLGRHGVIEPEAPHRVDAARGGSLLCGVPPPVGPNQARAC